MNNPIGYLLYNRVRIENANSISSSITYGFPAITGFLGAFHAMSRRLSEHQDLSHIRLGGVLIACYDCQPRVYRQSPYSDYTFNQSRNPILKSGRTASIIEEGKVHLTLTLAVEVLSNDDLGKSVQKQLEETTGGIIIEQPMAGGSVRELSKYEPVVYFPFEKADQITPRLLPAFVLMDAQEDLIDLTKIIQEEDPDATALDALLDVATLHHVPLKEDGKVEWITRSAKTGRGWLVPIPVGYQAVAPIFEAGELNNCRTQEYPAQYVEAVYSLGKWVFPHRIDDVSKAFWRYHHQPEDDLYLVKQVPT